MRYENANSEDAKKPEHGDEFFFANVMIKVYQIPILFSNSSEFGCYPSEGAFIIMVYEKVVKKRQAKNSKEKKVKDIIKCRERGLPRHALGNGHLMIRESKMRRFCNFWLILFNVRSLKPFAQFIKQDEFKELK